MTGRLRTLFMLCLLAFAGGLPLAVQAQPSPSAPAPAERPIDFSPANIDAWANDVFGKAYAAHRFSGLGIIAVQNNKVVYTKTFGYQNPKLKTPIDPAVTRFRIGSTTKTFNALAIAKLVDEKRIHSLDDPVNRYLKRLQLPQMLGRDVTFWDLLNHRGGFEEPVWLFDLPAKLPLTAADIAKFVPRQDKDGQQYANYCNFCSAVLGLVVEDVTGEAEQDYLDHAVFRPLGMTETLLNMSRWPSPNSAVPYVQPIGKPAVEARYDPVPEFLAPAGSIDTTLNDISRYMVALLGGPGSDILSKQGWTNMFSRHFANHPASTGFGMIWISSQRNGVEVREHGGTIGNSHTELTLFPNQKAGIFITCMCPSEGGRPKPGSRFQLTAYHFHDMIMAKFLGPVPMKALPLGDLSPYVGNYITETRETRWPMRFAFLLGGHTIAVEKGDRGLMIDGLGPYQRVGDDVFRAPDINAGDPLFPYTNHETMIFIRNAAGQVEHLTGSSSLHLDRKLAPLQEPPVQRGIWIVATLLVALGLASFAFPRGSALDRRAHGVLCVTAVLGLASSLLIVATFLCGWFNPRGLVWSVFREWAVALAIAPILTGLATVACAIVAVGLWREGGEAKKRAALATLVTLGGILLSGFFLANS